MVIRKYIAPTEQEASRLAKEELGHDAIIMNVKKSNPKGLKKLFHKSFVEVTAAVDDIKKETDSQNDLPDFQKLQEAIQETNAVLEAEEKRQHQKENPDTLQTYEAESSHASDLEQGFTEEIENYPKQDSKELEERLSNLQDLIEKQIQSEKKEETNSKSKAYFDLIRKKLLDNEVEETYVDQILDDISVNLSNTTNLDQILSAVYQKIVLKIGQPHLIDIRNKKTKFIFFIGPTGVGKTTTIAKIASSLKLAKKRKIALVTSDTYRIAAVEQLKTYANILGIPLQVVYSPEDMKKAMEELRDYDLVFVDTAGRSHNNAQQKEDIQELMESVPEEFREVYLVLSATTKYKDLKKISQTYAEISKYSLIFTKLDETDTVGSLYNIHMLTGAPLSYVTCGQNVPNDIRKIDAQGIAKQLLGGNS